MHQTKSLFTALFYFLSQAYREGDMSVMYPIARAFPVLMVPPLLWLLGQCTRLPHFDWLAILLIVTGCLLSPMRTFHDISIRNYLNKGTIFYSVGGSEHHGVFHC